MASVFHEGERAVQARAGIADRATRVGNGIHPTIPPAAQAFLNEQEFAVIGASDEQGRVWATAVFGVPGFVEATETAALFHALPPAGDPLETVLESAAIGVLVIDPATRRRMRLNGTAHVLPDGTGFEVRAEQVYANCPKYIQKREPVEPSQHDKKTMMRQHTVGALTETQQKWITRADTFFIATAHPLRGADASHRGGNPGFVRVSDKGNTLVWPDYAGNMMFNTLGNLSVNPSAGLLFWDWENGSLLQLTGQAETLWDESDRRDLPGAERAVRFRVTEAIETTNALLRPYRLTEYSRFNPAG